MQKPRLAFADLSDKAPTHETNQDALLAAVMHSVTTWGIHDIGLFIVSDGFGENGASAAQTVTQSILTDVTASVYQPMMAESPPNLSENLQNILVSAFQKAHKAIRDQHPLGWASCTAALIMGDSAHIAHVGVSRVYLVTANEIKLLNSVHDVIHQVEELGRMSLEEAAQYPHTFGPYRALGFEGDLTVGFVTQALRAENRLLLCSEGLIPYGDDKSVSNAIKQIVMLQPNLRRACELLIGLAQSKKTQTDTSVILVKMEP